MIPERLAMLTDQLADLIETLDPVPYLDPKLATIQGLAKRFGIDVIGTCQAMAASFLRSLPPSAASDPDRAAAMASWAAECLAWVRGETDDPPPPLTL